MKSGAPGVPRPHGRLEVGVEERVDRHERKSVPPDGGGSEER